MKINKDIEASGNQQILRERFSQIKDNAKKAAEVLTKKSDDSVQVPLGRAVQNTLDSLGNDQVRAARVAELKALVQSGRTSEYLKGISKEVVAKKTADEIDIEILSSKAIASDQDEDA